MTHPAAPTEQDQQLVLRVLTVDEAAKILRISRGLAFAAIHTGELPHIRIGRRILVPAHSLRALLGSQAPPDQPDPAADTTAKRVPRENPPPPDPARQAALRELAATLEALIAARQPDHPDEAGW